MNIGYPCINSSIGCTANTTFRLANYSKDNLITKVTNNLSCLKKILQYNKEHGLLFFRISSDLVPFASHPVCRFDWVKHFHDDFQEIGSFIKKNKFRISMHPDQFVLINALKYDIVKRSIKELDYHCKVLDAMSLPISAKVQIHIGGVYGDREASKKRFIDRYKRLPDNILQRLAIENDHYMYSLKDCLDINRQTGIPIIFDSFHHECFNNKENMHDAITSASKTWKKKDGILMLDYSSQKPDARIGTHTMHIDKRHFSNFLEQNKDCPDFDIMLEIKDKEKSALIALGILKKQSG